MKTKGKSLLYSSVGETGRSTSLAFTGFVWNEKERKTLVLNEPKKPATIKV